MYPIAVPIKQSNYYCAFTGIVIAISMLSVGVLQCALWAKILLMLSLGFIYFPFFKKNVLFHSERSINHLTCFLNRWQIVLKNGCSYSGRLLHYSTYSFFITMLFKTEEGLRFNHIIFKDSLSENTFRKLLLHLNHAPLHEKLGS